MSHFTTIETQIRDTGALRDACGELGLTLAENAVARGYGSLTRRGDYVIQIPSGPYDIALSKQPDGTYELATDWWGGHVEKAVGKDYGRLLQLYGVHKATREARRKGYTVRRKQHTDGAIKLVIGGVR
jgi:hypothetical protein